MGHIYYHVPEGRPSVASELRFRTDEDGQDFQMPNGVPWALPIYRIVTTPDLAPLKELLIKDNIVTPKFMQHCERLFPESFATVAPGHVLYGLRQWFPVHICRNKVTVWIVGEEKVLDLHVGSSWLGFPHVRQKNHKGVAMVELVYHDPWGYQLRVTKQPPLASPDRPRSIPVGRWKNLRCYSLTQPDYLPVLEELVGRGDLH
ncbi:hypothetical protein BT96DRAFT_918374 [Gymnopus androsaceus JB14]|uniref:Uncharacterized protein n=1 Tax=Gymnopus androsaceus JB14 TaxID=1447944 RepID=A0A6A4HWB6_9AGAR|nr:hypothetical protein BT96DRAFT_918374 [Gymnopus androsaceus JB14]